MGNFKIGDIVSFVWGKGEIIEFDENAGILVKLLGNLQGSGHDCDGRFEKMDYWYFTSRDLVLSNNKIECDVFYV